MIKKVKKFEDGNYAVTVADLKKTVSKAGNEMLVVTLQNKDDEQTTVYLLTAPGKNKMANQFIDALNLPVTDGKINVTPEAAIGKSIWITVMESLNSSYSATNVVSYSRNYAKELADEKGVEGKDYEMVGNTKNWL